MYGNELEVLREENKELKHKIEVLERDRNVDPKLVEEIGMELRDIRFGIILLKKGLSTTQIKLDILNFINENVSPTISEISRGVGFDYKNTHRYIQEFKKHNIVKLTPNTPARGKKVFVEIIPRKQGNPLFDRVAKILTGGKAN